MGSMPLGDPSGSTSELGAQAADQSSEVPQYSGTDIEVAVELDQDEEMSDESLSAGGMHQDSYGSTTGAPYDWDSDAFNQTQKFNDDPDLEVYDGNANARGTGHANTSNEMPQFAEDMDTNEQGGFADGVAPIHASTRIEASQAGDVAMAGYHDVAKNHGSGNATIPVEKQLSKEIEMEDVVEDAWAMPGVGSSAEDGTDLNAIDAVETSDVADNTHPVDSEQIVTQGPVTKAPEYARGNAENADTAAAAGNPEGASSLANVTSPAIAAATSESGNPEEAISAGNATSPAGIADAAHLVDSEHTGSTGSFTGPTVAADREDDADATYAADNAAEAAEAGPRDVVEGEEDNMVCGNCGLVLEGQGFDRSTEPDSYSDDDETPTYSDEDETLTGFSDDETPAKSNVNSDASRTANESPARKRRGEQGKEREERGGVKEKEGGGGGKGKEGGGKEKGGAQWELNASDGWDDQLQRSCSQVWMRGAVASHERPSSQTIVR